MTSSGKNGKSFVRGRYDTSGKIGKDLNVADTTAAVNAVETVTTVNGGKTGGKSLKIRSVIESYIAAHQGETFDLDKLARDQRIEHPENRNEAARILSRFARGELKLPENLALEKRGNFYRSLLNNVITLDIRNSTGAKNLALCWPSGTDQSQFGFDGRVLIPEKGLIVLAGVTNTGKSTFCRNFLWMNMDSYRCTYFTSETSEDDFAEYASRMTWNNYLKEDGQMKFRLVWRENDFKDVVDPDGVNIIDWLNIYENFYAIGEVLDGIKSKLNKGIVLVAIQKHPEKGLGIGGMWAEHKASLYLAMDFGRITVEKAKKWVEWNPNHRSWGFDIVDQGTHFHNIRLLKKCGFCWNGKKGNAICTSCNGTGFVNDVTKELEEAL